MAAMIEDKKMKGVVTPPKSKKRKGVDKWKNKKWFTVLAPSAFNNVPLAHTPSEDAELVKGRVVLANARDLTGNIKKNQLMLRFRVDNVQGSNAHTQFDGMAVQPSSLRRLVRRRSSKIESVEDVVCKDGTRARIKTLALSSYKVSVSQGTTVRKIIGEEMRSLAKEKDYPELLLHLLASEGNAPFLERARKIAPMKRIDFLKATRLTRQ